MIANLANHLETGRSTMPANAALDTEYENGVADVLAFRAGGAAVVERNVRLLGHRSGVRRQVDVLVRGRVFGLTEAMMLVDCKRWAKPVDVGDVGAFLDLVEDVGADVGLLVTTKGGSGAAHERARQARGIRLEVLTLGELTGWAPSGTVITEYRIPTDKHTAASRALRRAGLRVSLSTACPPTEDEVMIEVFRHYGVRAPSSEVQIGQWEQAKAAMAGVGVLDPIHVSHGIRVSGGTPGHRSLDVVVEGHPIGLKILAALEAEAEEQLEAARIHLARLGVPPDVVSSIKPDGWPVQGLFAGWAS